MKPYSWFMVKAYSNTVCCMFYSILMKLWHGYNASWDITCPLLEVHPLNVTPMAVIPHFNIWFEMTYPLPSLNGAVVEVWEWISNLCDTLLEVIYFITYQWCAPNIDHYGFIRLLAIIQSHYHYNVEWCKGVDLYCEKFSGVIKCVLSIFCWE